MMPARHDEIATGLVLSGFLKSSKRHRIASSVIVGALLLALATSSRVQASHPSGGGAGDAYITQSFHTSATSVYGTSGTFDLHLNYFEGNTTTNYFIRHQLLASNGQYGQFGGTYAGLAGFHNDGADTGGDKVTTMEWYYCIWLGGSPECESGLGRTIDQYEYYDELDVRVAMRQRDACRINGGGCYLPSTELIWVLNVDSGSLAIEYDILHQVYPVHVREARHGLQTTDTEYDDDVHIDVEDNVYYTMSSCSSERCQYDWGAGHKVAMTVSPVDTGSGTLAYQSANVANKWHMCYGGAPESKCGCSVCATPANTPNPRWLPEIGYPLLIDIDGTFGSLQDELETRIEEAADDYQSEIGSSHEIFEIGGSPTIVFSLLTSYPDEFQLAEWDPTSTLESTEDWGCDPGDDYYKRTAGTIELNGEDFDWTSPDKFSDRCPWVAGCTPPGGPTITPVPTNVLPQGRGPMRIIVYHELGHALGVGHHGSSPGTPPPPDTSVTRPYLAASPGGYGWQDITIVPDLVYDGIHATQCLMGR